MGKNEAMDRCTKHSSEASVLVVVVFLEGFGVVVGYKLAVSDSKAAGRLSLLLVWMQQHFLVFVKLMDCN